MAEHGRPAVGMPAPEIVLPDLHGRTWELGDHLGRTVVVVFHRHIH
ncbi:MAG: peroxiredoxin family protein [Acidimicrobiia bacterium]|nr:peroxiredoxin family protein [Acidimicrobiia bacterium]